MKNKKYNLVRRSFVLGISLLTGSLQSGVTVFLENNYGAKINVKTSPMQPEGQQDPYQYLRTRLPAEIPDQVVKLIAYNKEAFNDFAAIETQDDLDSFNKRYNVELVVNV